MDPTKVIVLGARGMLGSMVVAVLGANPRLRVAGTATDPDAAQPDGDGSSLHGFDARRDEVERLLAGDDYGWVVNAIGITNAQISNEDPAALARAVEINALFPFRLAAAAAERGQRVIQIATDGVFAGANAPYDEGAPHDAVDPYGKTKSLGEVPAGNVLHLRCSIVGRAQASDSLLGWALSHPAGATIPGYTNHRWNGLTTLHFAKLCEAIIVERLDPPSPLHVVPADAVSKAELLEHALRAFGRDDIRVEPGADTRALDRTLTTVNPDANQRLWAAAGYRGPPAISAMLEELAAAVGR